MTVTARLLAATIGLGIVLGIGLLLRPGGADAQGEAKQKTDLALVSKKLDEVLATQQRILDQLEAMMEELGVVKIRCTN